MRLAKDVIELANRLAGKPLSYVHYHRVDHNYKKRPEFISENVTLMTGDDCPHVGLCSALSLVRQRDGGHLTPAPDSRHLFMADLDITNLEKLAEVDPSFWVVQSSGLDAKHFIRHYHLYGGVMSWAEVDAIQQMLIKLDLSDRGWWREQKERGYMTLRVMSWHEAPPKVAFSVEELARVPPSVWAALS